MNNDDEFFNDGDSFEIGPDDRAKREMKRLLARITSHPDVCHGVPCIKGTRHMVWTILDMLAADGDFTDVADEIMGAYPELKVADLKAAMLYAARVIESQSND